MFQALISAVVMYLRMGFTCVVDSFQASLTSPHPSLRFASATTLRQLVERNPDTSAHKDLEMQLLTALDDESESFIESAIQTAVAALLSVQCPSNPHNWITACSDILLGNVKECALRKVSHQTSTPAREGSLVADTDDDPDITDIAPDSIGMCLSSIIA